MPKVILWSALAIALTLASILAVGAANRLPRDIVSTSAGDLEITLIGHASLMFSFQGRIIHVDPWSKQADYGTLPPADIVLLTHEHRDHLDATALEKVVTDKTRVFLTAACADRVRGQVLQNGDTAAVADIGIEAVPAYNLVHMGRPGVPFHPRGNGNGYILSFGNTRVYVAGDTENTPEMKGLTDIAVAFLPMNLPYTMTPEMVADAVRAFQPQIVYPYHTGDTDLSRIEALLKDWPGTEVRLRKR